MTATEMKPYAPEQWETLQAAARRTGYAYQTFKNWKSQRKLPFPVYSNNLVRPQEVDQWIESTKLEPCRPNMERIKM
jgi:hypothetical protein